MMFLCGEQIMNSATKPQMNDSVHPRRSQRRPPLLLIVHGFQAVTEPIVKPVVLQF